MPRGAKSRDPSPEFTIHRIAPVSTNWSTTRSGPWRCSRWLSLLLLRCLHLGPLLGCPSGGGGRRRGRTVQILCPL